jgi:hypothetical protein
MLWLSSSKAASSNCFLGCTGLGRISLSGIQIIPPRRKPVRWRIACKGITPYLVL